MISDELLELLAKEYEVLAEEYEVYVNFFSLGIISKYTFEDYVDHHLQSLEKDKEACLNIIRERIKNQYNERTFNT